VRRAIALGFSLPELARILGVRDRGGAPCRQVYTLAVSKLAKIDRQIADLVAIRSELSDLVAQWGKQLDATPHGERAGLLEALLRPAKENYREE
jgi:DNA-binding transcriptional MerR regulator